MTNAYAVLSPWAEADPPPLKGIAPRLPELKDQTIGLWVNSKPPAAAIRDAVEAQLRARYPGLRFSHYYYPYNREITEPEETEAFAAWVRGVDAVITAVGD